MQLDVLINLLRDLRHNNQTCGRVSSNMRTCSTTSSTEDDTEAAGVEPARSIRSYTQGRDNYNIPILQHLQKTWNGVNVAAQVAVSPCRSRNAAGFTAVKAPRTSRGCLSGELEHRSERDSRTRFCGTLHYTARAALRTVHWSRGRMTSVSNAAAAKPMTSDNCWPCVDSMCKQDRNTPRLWTSTQEPRQDTQEPSMTTPSTEHDI